MQNNKTDSYNRGGFLALLGSIIFSLAFFAYIVYGYKGIDLKEITETTTDGATQGLAANGTPAAAFDAAKITKPWVSSPELIAHGKEVFASNCAVCHGQEGKGDGPAGASLVPPPRNFVEGKWKKGGDTASLFETVRNGLPGSSMASFAHVAKIDRWSVVHFIRSITQNKVPDDLGKLEKFAQTAQ